jgi:hypothetical protein
LKTRQLVLIAGRTLLVEKDDWYSDFSMDASDFTARRSAARASDHIMYRDTDRGVRYLVKRGGDRVVSEELTRRSKALAMGTRIDPAFDFPVPILGINYLNFDCVHRGQRAETAARRHAVRREHRLLRHRRAGHRQGLHRGG